MIEFSCLLNFRNDYISRMKIKHNIVIIGAGLSGLTTAYLLSKKNISCTILEASPRIGGRIETIKGKNETPLELGATWFSEIHPNLLSLIDELGLKKYPQYSKGISLFQTKSFEPPQEFFVPQTETPSYRIAGGTQSIIDTLASKIPLQSIHLDSKVTAIKKQENNLFVETENGKSFPAKKVIICMPPQLASSIEFSPKLPEHLTELLPTVQTWMSGSVKFTVEYAEPFWRNAGYSGMLYSHSGIIAEMYDHTNMEETKYGFTGFLSGGCMGYDLQVRNELVLKQLSELLGKEALAPLSYRDKIWTDEFILNGNQVIYRPHQNNGHPLLQLSYMDESLFFANTETAEENPGYMDGAVLAAKETAEKLSTI